MMIEPGLDLVLIVFLLQDGGCCGGKENSCCLTKDKDQDKDKGNDQDQDKDLQWSLFNPSDFTPLDPTQELIFPPELTVSPV